MSKHITPSTDAQRVKPDQSDIARGDVSNDNAASKRGRGGRKPISADKKKSHKFLVSADVMEAAEIDRRAAKAGLAPAVYLREAGLRRRVVTKKGPSAQVPDPEMMRQISAIGNNLNQVVALMHTAGRPIPRDLSQALKYVNDWFDKNL